MSVFREALAPLSAAQPVVHEREVLRISGRLASFDDVSLARNEVLRWARKRAGANLPDAAWSGLSFEHFAGGRDCVASTYNTSLADIWALRANDPDKTVPGRNWTTETVIGGEKAGEPWFGLRLLVNSSEADSGFAPHTPGLVQQIVDHQGLYRSGRSLQMVTRMEDGDDLGNLLTRRDRRLPVIVITPIDDNQKDSNLIDSDALGRAVLGLAHVVKVDSRVPWWLTEKFGKRLSVFEGAVRYYDVGFDESADPFRHRLFLAARLHIPEFRDECIDWLRRACAASSLRQLRLGTDLVTFAEVRRASLRLEQSNLAVKGAPDSVQLKIAKDQLTEINKRLDEKNESTMYYEQEHNNAEEAKADAISRLHGAQGRIEKLEKELSDTLASTEDGSQLPESWSEFYSWCAETLATKLRLEASARRAIRRPAYEDVRLAARCLLWLAGPARDSLMGRTDLVVRDAPIESGVRNSPCGGDAYSLGAVKIDWHIKNGGNTRDPRRCLRIYWGWDEASSEIIVADMPAHRTTGAS